MKFFNQTETQENIGKLTEDFKNLKRLMENNTSSQDDKIKTLSLELEELKETNKFLEIRRKYPKGFVLFKRGMNYYNVGSLEYFGTNEETGRTRRVSLDPLNPGETPETIKMYGKNIATALIREDEGATKIVVTVRDERDVYKAVYLVSDFKDNAIRVK